MFLLVLKAVSAIVYYDQIYGGGWSAFGYGFGDFWSFYMSYPGWIDFFAFFIVFFSLGNAVFVKKFDKKAGKALALSLSVFLSLSLVLYEMNLGISLLQEAGGLAVLLILLTIIIGSFVITGKLKAPWWLSLLVSGAVAYTVLMLFGGITGRGVAGVAVDTLGNVGRMFAGFVGNWWWAIILMVLALAILVSLFMWLIKSWRESDITAGDTGRWLGRQGWKGTKWLGKKGGKGSWWLAKKGGKYGGKASWWGLKKGAKGLQYAGAGGLVSGGGLWNKLFRRKKDKTKVEPKDADNLRKEIFSIFAQILDKLNTLNNYLNSLLNVGLDPHGGIGQNIRNLISNISMKIENLTKLLNETKKEMPSESLLAILQRLQNEIREISSLHDLIKSVFTNIQYTPDQLNGIKRVTDDIMAILEDLHGSFGGEDAITSRLSTVINMLEAGDYDIKRILYNFSEINRNLKKYLKEIPTNEEQKNILKYIRELLNTLNSIGKTLKNIEKSGKDEIKHIGGVLNDLRELCMVVVVKIKSFVVVIKEKGDDKDVDKNILEWSRRNENNLKILSEWLPALNQMLGQAHRIADQKEKVLKEKGISKSLARSLGRINSDDYKDLRKYLGLIINPKVDNRTKIGVMVNLYNTLQRVDNSLKNLLDKKDGLDNAERAYSIEVLPAKRLGGRSLPQIVSDLKKTCENTLANTQQIIKILNQS